MKTRMKSRRGLVGTALLGLLLYCAASFAASAATDDPLEDPRLHSAGFLRGHPDLRFRLNGLDSQDAGRATEAFGFFQRAARYGDKPSQAVIAEMLWDGRGVARNRALAYAWMDLAAERGYTGFLALRERYWAAMNQAERAEALRTGDEVFAQYGDAVAKPRLAGAMRRARNSMTGSRTGMKLDMKIYAGASEGSAQFDNRLFYDDRFWDPDQYQALMDRAWKTRRIGSARRDEVRALPDSLPRSRIQGGGFPE
ncbi:hypothetical protein [Stenotrophomonas sp. YIM B06876]|uniref:hypothetical protein n=1 Tax=Stenotrophomonas sp. YIM B06876 TaxID=3060211 RepID=UPI002739F063|nr:hypothetical protein [Stenotrophomonas sp. YIM B06876]